MTHEDKAFRAQPQPRTGQLNLNELTAVVIATCAALDAVAADLSPSTIDALRTAHTKLCAGIETLAEVTPPNAWPRTLAGVVNAAPRALPVPKPRRSPRGGGGGPVKARRVQRKSKGKGKGKVK